MGPSMIRVVRIKVCARGARIGNSEAAMGEPVDINQASICALESASTAGNERGKS